MKNRNPERSAFWFTGPGIAIISTTLLAISFVIFYVVIPFALRQLILKETQLVNGTQTWEKWTNVRVPILIKFHIFNVTNVEGAENGEKFNLQDVGPYVWEEKRTKQIVSIDEDEDTVTYREVVWYYFRRDLSVGDQDDTVNIVNVPFIAAATLAYRILYSSFANYVLGYFLDAGETFVSKNVKIRELVFDGVKLDETYDTLASFGVVDLPEEFIEDTFAFYNQKNGTPTREFKVYRGVKNPENFGKLVQYDGKKELTWWTNNSLPTGAEQYCNKINGTDGTIVAPFVSKDHYLYVFVYEVCRSIFMRFDGEVDFKGIPAYQFTTPLEFLADPYHNEDNRCFCPDPGNGLDNSCSGSGTYRLFPCKKDIPIAVSLPHFLNAADRWKNGVEGLKADEDKHKIRITVEPNSGAVLQILKRVQINLELQKLSGITAFDALQADYTNVPIFWAEERADPGEVDLAEIRERLVYPLQLIWLLKLTVFGVLLCFIFVGIFMSICQRRDKQSLLAQ